jgi:hypothetical protein
LVLFLWFAYQKTNLERLRVVELPHDVEVVGTVCGMTTLEAIAARKRCAEELQIGEHDPKPRNLVRARVALQ